MSTAAMALLVFTIIEAPTYGWGSARSLSRASPPRPCCSPRSSRWERRTAHPMLDVRLFRNMRFSAASGAITVSFFTLFGFIFLMTQYFQFIRGYGPLSTGVHLLPVALSVGVGSVAGTQLAVRAGPSSSSRSGWSPWPASTAGSRRSPRRPSATALSRSRWCSTDSGMGLTSAPATESIMGAVSRRQAGVGSAVNDSTRLLGGTLGVAVIGSVYASLYAPG